MAARSETMRHIASLLGLLLLAGCQAQEAQDGEEQRGTQLVRYTLSGTIEISNNCEGLLASIPGQVSVRSSLRDSRGQSVGGRAEVRLAPRRELRRAGRARSLRTSSRCPSGPGSLRRRAGPDRT